MPYSEHSIYLSRAQYPKEGRSILPSQQQEPMTNVARGLNSYCEVFRTVLHFPFQPPSSILIRASLFTHLLLDLQIITMTNLDNNTKNASDFIIVGGESPPSYSNSTHQHAEMSKTSPRGSTPTVDTSEFPEMTGAIELGDEVLTVLTTAVERLYEANRSTTIPVPILISEKRWTRRREYGSGDPAPHDVPREQFKARVQSMTTSESAGYACCLDLAKVLLIFSNILDRLQREPHQDSPKKERAEDEEEEGQYEYQTAAMLANVVVAASHEWIRARVRLGEDASYIRILSAFSIHISQCKTQYLESVKTLPRYFSKVASEISTKNDMSNCIELVRSHASLHVAKVWADVLASVLPIFVQSCATRYRMRGSVNLATTYAYFVEGLLEARLRKIDKEKTKTESTKTTLAPVKMGNKTDEKGGQDEHELEYTNPWAAFVLKRYGTSPVVQSGECPECMSGQKEEMARIVLGKLFGNDYQATQYGALILAVTFFLKKNLQLLLISQSESDPYTDQAALSAAMLFGPHGILQWKSNRRVPLLLVIACLVKDVR